MAKRKDKLMKAFMERPIAVGDTIQYPRHYISMRNDISPNELTYGTVAAVLDDYFVIKPSHDYDHYDKLLDIPKDEVKRYTREIGINPFPDMPWLRKLERNTYSLESILNKAGIEPIDTVYRRTTYEIGGMVVPELNWNPYVVKDGEKHFYQRELCWTLADERSFIDSIYHSIQCGTIIMRERPWNYLEKEIAAGNTDVAFHDIVDGKQRLNTLRRFLNDEFADSQGNYWTDLSERAQWTFLDSHSLGFAMLREDSTDEDTLQTFLSVNFAGKPMSRQHIKFVQSIAELFKK